MTCCLFVQWKKPTDASRFVINGEISEYSGTELQDYFIRLFANIPKFKEICSNKGNSNYKHRRKNYLYFVEGNFEETDIAGRNLVYIFATEENDTSKVVKILQEYSSLLGVTPYARDIKEIKKYNFKKKKNNKIILCVITTSILLLLFILLNLLNKQ